MALQVQLRPTFAFDVPEAPSVIADRLHDRLQGPELELRWARSPGAPRPSGMVDGEDFLVVTFVSAQRHFWSPWLHLDIQPEPPGTRLTGRFSPHPSVWMGFAFSYLVLGVLAAFAAMFGAAQVTMDNHPWALWIIPFAGIVAALLWWASLVGQRLARTQMRELRQRLDAALAQPGETRVGS